MTKSNTYTIAGYSKRGTKVELAYNADDMNALYAVHGVNPIAELNRMLDSMVKAKDDFEQEQDDLKVQYDAQKKAAQDAESAAKRALNSYFGKTEDIQCKSRLEEVNDRIDSMVKSAIGGCFLETAATDVTSACEQMHGIHDAKCDHNLHTYLVKYSNLRPIEVDADDYTFDGSLATFTVGTMKVASFTDVRSIQLLDK